MRHNDLGLFGSCWSAACSETFFTPFPQQKVAVPLPRVKLVGESSSQTVNDDIVMFMRVMQAGGSGTFDVRITAGLAFSIPAFPGPAIVFPPMGRPSP